LDHDQQIATLEGQLMAKNPELVYRRAGSADIALLARLNAQLIADEKSDNPMSVEQLEARMREFIEEDGYKAVLFAEGEEVLGYALYRVEPSHLFLRQFFVVREHRNEGVGRAAFEHLSDHEWENIASIRLDVLAGNKAARSFWESLGFDERSVRLELQTASKRSVRKACGAIVYRKRFGRYRFLLIRQVSDGNWGFPKGHVDEGETEEETAAREVLEETGARIRPIPGFYERLTYLTPKGRKKIGVYFLSEYTGEPLAKQEGEIDEIGWYGYREARALLPFENVRRLLDQAYRFLR
jgi:8-oxo-dGTP pyrophosphatase MutT (NUDIX family)